MCNDLGIHCLSHAVLCISHYRFQKILCPTTLDRAREADISGKVMILMVQCDRLFTSMDCFTVFLYGKGLDSVIFSCKVQICEKFNIISPRIVVSIM